MAKKKPVFDYSICVACGICVQACPFSTLELQKEDVDKYHKPYPEIARPNCTGCGMCSRQCPLDAIKMVEETINEG